MAARGGRAPQIAFASRARARVLRRSRRAQLPARSDRARQLRRRRCLKLEDAKVIRVSWGVCAACSATPHMTVWLSLSSSLTSDISPKLHRECRTARAEDQRTALGVANHCATKPMVSARSRSRPPKPLPIPDHAWSRDSQRPRSGVLRYWQNETFHTTSADHSVASCAHKVPTWQMTRKVPSGNPRCARHAPCASSCAVNCSEPAGPSTSSCAVAPAGPPVTTTTR